MPPLHVLASARTAAVPLPCPPARTVAAAGLLSRYPGSSTFFKRASEFRACSSDGERIVINPQLIRAS